MVWTTSGLWGPLVVRNIEVQFSLYIYILCAEYWQAGRRDEMIDPLFFRLRASALEKKLVDGFSV